MPVSSAGSKTEKPQVTFKWDEAATWPDFQKLASDGGFSSVNLFARHLCEQAILNSGAGVGERVATESAAAVPDWVEDRLVAITDALDGLREEVQKLSDPQEGSTDALDRIRKAIRGADENLRAEFLHLRQDAAQQLSRAGDELLLLRKNLAEIFALLLVKVDPRVKPQDAQEWVRENFFKKKV